LHERIEELLRTILGDETLSLAEETRFEDLPGWDSVAFINLLFGLETAIGTQLDPEAVRKLETIGSLEAYVGSRAA
jgi:acyl carrier protein